jgi:hypothetical protein
VPVGLSCESCDPKWGVVVSADGRIMVRNPLRKELPAVRNAWPNKGLQLTAYSLRCAPASGSS